MMTLVLTDILILAVIIKFHKFIKNKYLLFFSSGYFLSVGTIDIYFLIEAF